MRAVVVVAIAAAMLPVTGARADNAGVDMALAVAETAVDQAEATRDAAEAAAANPTVFCEPPVPWGGGSPGVVTDVAVVSGVDVMGGAGTCYDVSGRGFDTVLTLTVQYRAAGGGWPSTGCSMTFTTSSVNRVGVVVAPAWPCVHPPGDESAGRPHRVRARLETTLGGGSTTFSGVWQG